MTIDCGMSGVSLRRSTQLVSIDAHPANNSLVITYEISVVAEDESNGLELGRRNKRDQFQISISTFDNLDGKAKPLSISALAEEIIARCPMLAEANQADTLEDIQLNLLYLFNRKQAQLNQPSRPSSSASVRNKPNNSFGPRGTRSLPTAVRAKDSIVQKSKNPLESPIEIYQRYRERELGLAKRRDGLDYERLDAFVDYLDRHLLECERDLELGAYPPGDRPNIEALLEDLYGEIEEKRRSIAALRHCVQNDDANLISVACNRLMVYALLRLLRDCSSRDLQISESILYCLIRFTSFEDVFNSMPFSDIAAPSENESPDLVRVIIDLLGEHIKNLAANSDQNVKLITSKSYYTNSLLVVMANLLRLDHADSEHRLRRKLAQQQNGIKLADILTDSMVLFAKHLPRDIRTSNTVQERIILTLVELFSIGAQLSTLKHFVNLIRAAPRIQQIVDSMLVILNCLQLSRPGSGSSQFQQVLAHDATTLSMVYELEIELMLMMSNLILNSRFRTRFARKQLALKCVLRSLVVFLASNRQSNTLSPFNQSLVLIAPLRCLYQLCCCESVRHELFESRVIIRCLLEYLLLASSDLKTEIESSWQDFELTRGGKEATKSRRTRAAGADLKLTSSEQIVLSSLDARQYIICLWINLCARPEASIYEQTDKRDEEADRLIRSYVKLALSNLDSFAKLVVASDQRQIREHLMRSLTGLHLLNYLQMKLVRNLSEHLNWSYFEPCLNQLVSTLLALLNMSRRHNLDIFVPLLVESLAVLANVIEFTVGGQVEPLNELASLVSELFAGNCALIDCTPSSGSDVENDDLLLISVNLLGRLAARYEICPKLESISASIIQVIDSALEHRAGDTQLLISATFCLNQLLRHATFLQHFGSLFDALSSDESPDQAEFAVADQLLERLCSLVQHPDSSMVKLVDQILDKLKQVEESRSLADSVTYKRRFTSYNHKWLRAIRANREEPPDEATPNDELTEQLGLRGVDHNVAADVLNQQPFEFEDYRQLRTITASSSARTSSTLTSRSSASQGNSNSSGSRRSENYFSRNGDIDDQDEDGDEDEDTFSEPDVNVIDSMSMIGHLRGRQALHSSASTGSDVLRQT